MKGIFNQIPPRPKYKWDVSDVLNFLRTLFPLCELSLKTLTLKVVALIALLLAPRALVSMNIDSVNIYDNCITFVSENLLKTTRPSSSCCLNSYHFVQEELCVMHTFIILIEQRMCVNRVLF